MGASRQDENHPLYKLQEMWRYKFINSHICKSINASFSLHLVAGHLHFLYFLEKTENICSLILSSNLYMIIKLSKFDLFNKFESLKGNASNIFFYRYMFLGLLN